MENSLTEKIIGAAIEVHRHLGPGLLESTYERCLAREFEFRKIAFERQKACPLTYKGLLIEEGYRIDFIIRKRSNCRNKIVDNFSKVHSNFFTYLRLLKIRSGLLLNFNTAVLKAGIKRLSL